MVKCKTIANKHFLRLFFVVSCQPMLSFNTLGCRMNFLNNKTEIMKKLLTALMFLGAIQLQAQQPSRESKLLKNEALQSETGIAIYNEPVDRGGFKTNAQRNNGNMYRRNTNAASELFLRIPEAGYFTVVIGRERVSSENGDFRFFNLMPGRATISIYDNGYLAYRSGIVIGNSSRVLLDFFSNSGLYHVSSVTIRSSGGRQRENVWNDGRDYSYNNDGYSYYNNARVLNKRDFTEFLTTVNRELFDNGKVDIIKAASNKTAFTAEQVAMLIKTLDFDSRKLDVAKLLYKNCADKQNYFKLYPSFDFDSYARSLRKFIEEQ